MKIAMDEQFTTVGQVKMVKATMKEFKSSHTDAEILEAFLSQSELWYADGKLLECEVTAYPKSSYTGECFFHIRLLTYRIRNAFHESTFYMDKDLNLTNGDIRIDKYEMTRDGWKEEPIRVSVA